MPFYAKDQIAAASTVLRSGNVKQWTATAVHFRHILRNSQFGRRHPNQSQPNLDRREPGTSRAAPPLPLVEWSFLVVSSSRVHGDEDKCSHQREINRQVPKTLFDLFKIGFRILVGDWLTGPQRTCVEYLITQRRLESANFFGPGRCGHSGTATSPAPPRPRPRSGC